ncbi:sperm-associated antigen 16 protein isoform X4 [Struthio camelus]|uniref:sperm-associated antigen 16 protein isoform X4 n=1 Tax=Struthio camelus TaxID=8801 RepID=UPI003603DF99
MEEAAGTEASFCLQKVTITDDSEDDYQYEEVSADDEFSIQEGDEDLSKALQTIQEQAEDAQILASRSALSSEKSVSELPETEDDFFCNFLVRMGMSRTLDCFQTEWYELAERGVLTAKDFGLVPTVFTRKQQLEAENMRLKKDLENYKLAANKAKDALLRMQKERDFHQMHHRRVVQEKNKLICDIKRLKTHYASYEPVLKQLTEKYQATLRQKMLISLERDIAVGQATLQNLENGHAIQIPMTKAGQECERKKGLEGPTQKALQEARQQKIFDAVSSSYDPVKDPLKKTGKRYPKDSEFPVENQVKPYLACAKEFVQPLKSGVYRLSNTFKAHDLAVNCLALHPRKSIVATGSDDRLWKIWGFPNGNIIMTGEGHTDWLSGCCFHPSERCRRTLHGHKDSVNSIEFLPFSNTVLTSSADKTLSLWDARMGLCAHTLHGHLHSCNHAAFNMKGDTIASCDSCGVVKLWDIRKLVPMASIDAGPRAANEVVFDPSGRVVALASNDGTVKVVQLKSGQLASLAGHGDEVHSVIFVHEEEHLLSGGADGTVRLWT